MARICEQCKCTADIGKDNHGHFRDKHNISYAEMSNFKGYICKDCFNMKQIIDNSILPKMEQEKKIIKYDDEEWKGNTLRLYLGDRLVDKINLQELVWEYMNKHPFYKYQLE